jgi:hypothetical protein
MARGLTGSLHSGAQACIWGHCAGNGDPLTMNDYFKQCPMCRKIWQSKEEFLADTSLRLNGHQWNRQKVLKGLPARGLLLFTHTAENCWTTLAVNVADFHRHEYEESLYVGS